MLKMPIKELTLDNPLYPSLLKEIPDPPPKLYYRGNLKQADFPIAIVGSRKMTDYGKRCVEKIVSELPKKSFCIISGLAYGVDAHAHSCALNSNIRTIAVLGSSLDDLAIYPHMHKALANAILKNGGALISEIPVGAPALPRNFSLRNRIISGLSKAVVIVEAQIKSGALITANYALNQNRDVFAVPGSIFSSYCAGTNSLIKRGAKPVLSALDILEEFPELQHLLLDKAE